MRHPSEPCSSPSFHRRWTAAAAFGCLLACLLAWGGAAASAQTVRPLITDSAPFTIAEDVDFGLALAQSSAGATALVWADHDGIAGRVWNPDGSVAADGLRVSSGGFPELLSPSVFLADSGDLVVGWVEFILFFPPPVISLAYQRFDPLGQAAGERVAALDGLGFSYGLTTVGLTSNGVVEVFGDSSAEGSYGAVRRRFDAADEPLGEAEQLGPTAPERLPYAIRRATAPNGDSLVVWGSFAFAPNSTWEAIRVEGRLFDADGEPRGEAFEIAAPAAGFGVAAQADGSFLVAWNRPASDSISAASPAPYSIRARRVSASGLGPEAVVKEEEDGLLRFEGFELWAIAVAVDPGGRGLVLWSQQTESSNGRLEVVGQELAADLFPVGQRFVLQRPATSSNFFPAAASTASGKFFLAWHQSCDEPGCLLLKGQRLRLPRASGQDGGTLERLRTALGGPARAGDP